MRHGPSPQCAALTSASKKDSLRPTLVNAPAIHVHVGAHIMSVPKEHMHGHAFDL